MNKRNKSTIFMACLFIVLLLITTPLCVFSEEIDVKTKAAQTAAKLGDGPTLGLNLAGICDWNTELPFVDVFLETRAWISQRQGESWGRGPELEIDEKGWVKRLEKGCFAEVPLCTIEGGRYPSGVYTVVYKGEGRLDFGSARLIDEKPGYALIEVDSQKGGFWLRVMETNPDDYIRDIHVYMPGFGTDSERSEYGIWNPAFINRWRSMKVFRTMDWQATNGSKLKKWSDRPRIDDATYSRAGLPYEVIIDFIEHTDADLWLCVPDQADDDFVRNLALTLKTGLSLSKRIYLEYSNEVWNGSFEQNHRAAEKGRALEESSSDWEAAWRYVSHRSIEIFRIFEEVFDGDARLIRILPSQAAVPFVSEQILEFEDAWRYADALAIAPYIGLSVPNEDKEKIVALGIDGVLDMVENKILPETIEMMKKQKEVADRYGLRLISYEAGQHLVGLWGANDSEELNSILIGANRSQRMGEIYRKYYEAWEKIGGATICHFSSVGKWTKWGSWGLIEYADETPDDSPKYKATLEFAERFNTR